MVKGEEAKNLGWIWFSSARARVKAWGREVDSRLFIVSSFCVRFSQLLAS